MNAISRRGLEKLLEGKAKDVITDTRAWFKVARAADWEKLEEVRAQYPSADQAGNVLIFNIRRNRYRLIARVVYGKRKMYVKRLLTHAEYDRGEWKKWV